MVAVLLLSFSACAGIKVKFENFADCKADFETVSNYLRSYYVDYDCSGSATFEFVDGEIWKDCFVVSEEYAEEIKTIQQNGFTYAWVEEDSVIFWENETRYYGLLFSEKPKAALKSVKEWYDELKSKKLDKNWYEIGALDSI
jgi:hypothetical protein